MVEKKPIEKKVAVIPVAKKAPEVIQKVNKKDESLSSFTSDDDAKPGKYFYLNLLVTHIQKVNVSRKWTNFD